MLTDDKIIRGVRLIPPGWINAEQLLLLLLPLGGSRLLVGVFVGFSVVVWRSWLWPLLSPAAPCVCQSKSHASSSSSFLILFLGKFYNLVVVVCGCCSGMLSLNGRNASWLVFRVESRDCRGGRWNETWWIWFKIKHPGSLFRLWSTWNSFESCVVCGGLEWMRDRSAWLGRSGF
jgi:hypothetical protein